MPSLLTPTGRCLAAGAERAFLCRCPDDALDLAITLVEHLTEGGSTVIVESNRLAPLVAADLTCFVVSDATRDWKASSSAIVPRADTIVLSPGTLALPVSAPVLAALPSRPRTFRFRADWTVPHLAPWVARRVGPVADAGPGLHARHVAQFAIGGSWLGPRQPT